MKDFTDLLSGNLSRRQVKNIVQKLVKEKQLNQLGVGSTTYYTIEQKS